MSRSLSVIGLKMSQQSFIKYVRGVETKIEVDGIAKTETSPNTVVSVCARVLSRVLASSQRV